MTGDALDNLVGDLEPVELLVIDEISTCGAAALEVVSRGMQQVARVLRRRRFRRPPPGDAGPFGGIGALLICDFAQARAEYELDGGDAPYRERRGGCQIYGAPREASVQHFRGRDSPAACTLAK